MGEQKPAGKPFGISKQEVQDAWLKVKANKGAPGVDEQSIENFDTAVVDRDLGFIAAGQEGLAGGGHVGPTRW